MTAKFEDEPKHAGHSGAKDQPEHVQIPPVPKDWKPAPQVIPGYETSPAGVLSLQPDAQKAHDERVKEAAKAAEKAKGS